MRRVRRALVVALPAVSLALASCTAVSTPTPTVSSTFQIGTSRPLAPGALGINGASITLGSTVWGTAPFAAATADLAPGNIRVFGGTTANYWDWRTGTFFTGPGVPAAYAETSESQSPIPLSSFASLIKASGAVPIYDLNLVTSDLPDQLAMLDEARSLGMPVSRVELGNELYYSDPLVVSRFPTGAVYGQVASQWAAAIKQRFPGVEVAAVGATSVNSRGVQGSARQRTWNNQMIPELHDVDALTFHPYFDTGAAPGRSLAKAATVGTALTSAARRFALSQRQDLALLPPGMSAWYTEWTLLDHNLRIQGTWAQSLAIAAFGLLQFSDPRVTVSCLHDLAGNGVNAALFVNSRGLQFGTSESDALGYKIKADAPDTAPFDRSATGVAGAALYSAFDGSVSTAPLTANRAIPLRGLPNDGLIGAVVRTPKGLGAVLVNLTDKRVQATLPSSLAGDDVTIRSAGVSTLITSGDSVKTDNPDPAPSLVLPPYSIADLHA